MFWLRPKAALGSSVFICGFIFFMNTDWIMEKPGGALIRVRVKPRGGKDRIEGLSPEGFLVVRLCAPPVDDKANLSLIALLAKTLSLPKSAVSIQSGLKSRTKSVMATGISAAAASRSLLAPAKS
jgi:hypothetical protein